MGNSEVGHTNLGAGRVVRQDLVRIDDDLESGAFFANPVLVDACRRARGRGPAPVRTCVRRRRAQPRAPSAWADRARRAGAGRACPRARLHRWARHVTHQRGRVPRGHPRRRHRVRALLRDGSRRPLRPRRSAPTTPWCTESASAPTTAVAAVRARYEAGETDEFIEPIVIGDPAHGRIRGGRHGHLLQLPPRPQPASSPGRWSIPASTSSTAGRTPPLPFLVQMTEYAEDIHAPVAFASEPLTHVLASTLAAAGIAQVHAAETEKYAHVTYFFDGGSEHKQPGEAWELVASRRDVATYDLAPAMSAEGVAERFCARLASPRRRLRTGQLRQPRHGRAHRRDPGGGGGRRDHRPLPGARAGHGRGAAAACAS